MAVASLTKRLEAAEATRRSLHGEAAARADGLAEGLAVALSELVLIDAATLRAEAAGRAAVAAEVAQGGLDAARRALEAATATSGRSPRL